MACRRPGDKPLSKPMVVSLLTHICVARPQWVNLPSIRISTPKIDFRSLSCTMSIHYRKWSKCLIHCNDRAMIHWICGIKERTKQPQLHYYRNLASRTLHRSFAVGVSDGMAVYNGPRRVSNPAITNSPLPGTRKKGRPRKIWSECLKTYVHRCGLAGVDPLDRDACMGSWCST